jgi:Zn-dependent protease with chaperone function
MSRPLTIAVILLAWAALAMLLSPYALGRRHWVHRYPRVALGAWCATLVSGMGCVIATFVIVLHEAQSLAHEPPARLGTGQIVTSLCLSIGGFVLTAIVGGVTGLALWRAVPLIRHRVETRRLVARAMPITPYAMSDDVPVFSIDSPAPIARSLPGRRPMIVISTSLEHALTTDELGAVISHEVAHLRQRHHLLALLAALQRSCAPGLPCSRAFERSIALLIELAADDEAARRCGQATTASALRKVAGLDHDEAAEARSCRLEAAPIVRTAVRGGIRTSTPSEGII